MKQVDFEISTASLEYKGMEPKPAYVDDGIGQTVVCWKLTFFERLKLLFTGKLYVCSLSTPPRVPLTVATVNQDDFAQ